MDCMFADKHLKCQSYNIAERVGIGSSWPNKVVTPSLQLPTVSLLILWPVISIKLTDV